MFRRATYVLVAVALLGALPASAAAQDDNPVKGAWVVEKVTPADEEAVEDPQPALFVFSDTHYSLMAVIADSARANLPEEPTDADKAAAFDEFVANAGRYDVKGDSVTLRAFVAKVPNYMAEWPDNAQSFAIQREGDRLHWHFGETVVTLRRVEGTEPSY